jgi:dTDP-4-dehydrorhamnose reductase
VTDPSRIKAAIDKVKPDFIINCAAYTAVDKAESEKDICYHINEKGCKAIVDAIGELSIKVLHFSTDYVYGVYNGHALRESDNTLPPNVYAASKLAGEQILRNSNVSSMIIRTSWVVSPFGHNFVKTMLRLGKEKEHLTVVNDQYGSPTFTFDMVRDTMHIIHELISDSSNSDKWNETYNYSNEGIVTWCDIARAIMSISGSNCKVDPISTSQYPTPAKRPNWSVMSKRKITINFGIKPPHWYDALKRCINSM